LTVETKIRLLAFGVTGKIDITSFGIMAGLTSAGVAAEMSAR
jgi:hypothetical protein